MKPERSAQTRRLPFDLPTDYPFNRAADEAAFMERAERERKERRREGSRRYEERRKTERADAA